MSLVARMSVKTIPNQLVHTVHGHGQLHQRRKLEEVIHCLGQEPRLSRAHWVHQGNRGGERALKQRLPVGATR